MQKQLDIETLHGVFVDVANVGVLLSGDSGIGKSELALGLVDRGHRLVSDDSVYFSLKDNQLIGVAPTILKDFLEVRGLGILNIRKMFGDDAINNEKNLALIVNIINVSKKELHRIDRLHGIHHYRVILGITVPEVSLPVAPGRNLAILVEAAVKNHVLKEKGYHASTDFAKKHQDYMERNTNAR